MRNIWEIDDGAAIAAYAKEHWPEDVAHILRVADEVLENRFRFDLKWDMERTWEPVVFGGEIDWEMVPAGDIEFLFQFNRHRFFLCLGQAYLLTGDGAYGKKLVDLWEDWIERVPLTRESASTTWRSLETGLRGETWTKAWAYLKAGMQAAARGDATYAGKHAQPGGANAPTGPGKSGGRRIGAPGNDAIDLTALEPRIEGCLIAHARHVLASHSPYRYMSNWGVIENHGLFEIGLALEERALGGEFMAAALENLAIEARMQVMGDGVQWEQSPMYHNEVFHCFLDVCILGKRHGIAIPAELTDAVRKMAYANVAWMKPDHHQFIMGDSDDTDLRDYLSEAAWVLGDGALKNVGFPRLDFESAWELGMGGIREYDALGKGAFPAGASGGEDGPIRKNGSFEMADPPVDASGGGEGAGTGHGASTPLGLPFVSAALSDSGNYYLRSDWGEWANLLHFHCGTLGAGHGHSDLLHVDLVLGGEDVLTDGGRFTYVAGPDRYEFKNPDCHNTVTVDGEFFTVCKDSWECSKLSQPVKQGCVLSHGRVFGTGLPQGGAPSSGAPGGVQQDTSAKSAGADGVGAHGSGGGGRYEFVQGGHLGYFTKGEDDTQILPGVFVNRKIIHIKPDIYILCDEMYATGRHTYRHYFNFCEDGRIVCGEGPQGPHEAWGMPDEKCPKGGGLPKTAEAGDDSYGKCLTYMGKSVSADFVFIGEGLTVTRDKGRISRHYNKAVKRDRACVTHKGEGFASLITVVFARQDAHAGQSVHAPESEGGCRSGAAAPAMDESRYDEAPSVIRAHGFAAEAIPVYSALKGIAYPPRMAQALRISRGGHTYVAVVCHQEVNSPTDLVQADGCMGYGSVIVFEKGVDDLVGTVLCY
ncbi:MAG: heparinase II/III family protein [Lachnospiraceae bacterium]|jgi:hypothetical protein|nr:heparinase II/III family protein [Lachnospiraceae bacterium]